MQELQIIADIIFEAAQSIQNVPEQFDTPYFRYWLAIYHYSLDIVFK